MGWWAFALKIPIRLIDDSMYPFPPTKTNLDPKSKRKSFSNNSLLGGVRLLKFVWKGTSYFGSPKTDIVYLHILTLPETNMAPEQCWLGDDRASILGPSAYVQVLWLLVFREGIL